MSKATETSKADGQGGLSVQSFASTVCFQEIIRSEIRQDAAYDFVSCSTNGVFIALLGSRSELVTLELTSKFTSLTPLPYIKTIFKFSNSERPLDKLASQVDLEHIYDHSNVLDMQLMSLETVYTAPCSQDVPHPCQLAVGSSPKLLPNGHMVLATLNAYGMLQLLTKETEHCFWHPYEQGLNIAATLIDTLQPPFEIKPENIDIFPSYQAFIDRSWITMFAWRSTPSKVDGCVIVLGTAVGGLWTVTLSSDLRRVLAHSHLQTLLGRICYMHIHEDLMVVGDNTGLIHLYRFDDAVEEGLTLIKPLWLRPDRMGLQQALITHCAEHDCYYIVCCKAAHLLIWSMPRGEDTKWLETRFLVGGMKITALCTVGNSSYAVGTAMGQIYRIVINQKQSQLSVSKQLIIVEDSLNLQAVGLVCSPQTNLLTVFFSRNKEYMANTTGARIQIVVAVGKLEQRNALTELERQIMPNKAINCYIDLIADVRMEILIRGKQENYVNYAPIDMLAFDELATETQLQQLQLKFLVMRTLVEEQQHQTIDERLESEIKLLLVILQVTHIRLRLQYLSNLTELSPFQRKAVQCLLSAGACLRQQLVQQLEHAHLFTGTIKRFLSQMEVHFDTLQQKLGETSVDLWESTTQPKRCTISYIELPPDLEKHYCTLCGRQVLLEQDQLLELYPSDSTLLCPYCHAAYSLERYDELELD